jgi:hypothetical protein
MLDVLGDNSRQGLRVADGPAAQQQPVSLNSLRQALHRPMIT